ncbi:Myrosinase-binding protein 2 [Cardamine amara subsp. amara]|uniref:Myrosinase-binding protein 2 n=1 Tax=Cardamine amara subsp. amara TaxID=228776 RepID=A0ABD1BSL2_CARAN
MSQKVGPFGGNKGDAFDDSVFGYNGVRKVIIGENENGVVCIKIEYEKDGNFETQMHGSVTRILKEFVLNYPDEYITQIQGTYSDVSRYNTTIVKTLTFKTSHGRTSPKFGRPAFFEKDFIVEGKDGAKLTGFHGSSGAALFCIGAHFFASSSPLKQLEPSGGLGGNAWDDGVYDGVKKITIGLDCGSISYVMFKYVKGFTSVRHSHGKMSQELREFKVDYPSEYITSVEGSYSLCGDVTSLSFKTSKGRNSPVFGNVSFSKFALAVKDHMLVGFRGRNGIILNGLNALGANYAPVPAPVTPIPTPVPAPVPPKKLDAKGGNGGATWDDGFYEDVRKIYVGQGDSGVSFVKFEYANGKELVAGDGHGKMSLLGTEEFVLDFPNEYIVSVEGCYDKVFGIEADVVTMLKFKTNKRTSPSFGLDAGTTFVLEMKDHKIVGFHGKAGDFVHQVGVHVSPISKA